MLGVITKSDNGSLEPSSFDSTTYVIEVIATPPHSSDAALSP